MQDRPDAINLLETIQDLLIKDIMPAIKENEALSYKTLVSWNMLGVISREFKNGDKNINKELARLTSYLKEPEVLTGELNYFQKMEICSQLNEKLSDQIRKEKWTNENKEVWDLVKESLKEKLEISNPRFNSGE